MESGLDGLATPSHLIKARRRRTRRKQTPVPGALINPDSCACLPVLKQCSDWTDLDVVPRGTLAPVCPSQKAVLHPLISINLAARTRGDKRRDTWWETMFERCFIALLRYYRDGKQLLSMAWVRESSSHSSWKNGTLHGACKKSCTAVCSWAHDLLETASFGCTPNEKANDCPCMDTSCYHVRWWRQADPPSPSSARSSTFGPRYRTVESTPLRTDGRVAKSYRVLSSCFPALSSGVRRIAFSYSTPRGQVLVLP